jgi:hypothetical protein
MEIMKRLAKFDEHEIRKWTPLYVRYLDGFLFLFLGSVILIGALIMLDWPRFIWIELMGLLNCIFFLPDAIWEIKTGYLSSPLFIPKGLKSFKIKAISRDQSPLLFWSLLLFRVFLILVASALLIQSILRKLDGA